MRCPHHPFTKAVGYCTVCGEFGCASCLTEYEGQFYCRRHYRPIEEKIAREQRIEADRKRPQRQRLVAHLQDGRTARGVCRALHLEGDSLQLELVDRHGKPLGKSMNVRFQELKALFYVKSFDGRHEEEEEPPPALHPGGVSLVVEFADGEVLEGRTLRPYNPKEPRFFLVPADTDSNNISVLVERAALRAVHAPEEYHEHRRQERDRYVNAHLRPGHPREAIVGDYYFEQHDYRRALKHYRLAAREKPNESAIRKRIAASEYNLAVRYLKQRDFRNAKKALQAVLKEDPSNTRARRKLEEMRDYVKRKQSGSSSSAP